MFLTETGVVLSSAMEAVMAKMSKGATVGKTRPESLASAKKTTAKSQKDGKAKGNAAVQLPPVVPHSESGDQAVGQAPGAGAQGDTQTTPVVAVKTPTTVKPTKAEIKEKQKKKRKLADAALGEPKKKKQKGETGSEMKKKKKSKSSSGTKSLKKKDGKEKKSSKSQGHSSLSLTHVK